MHTQAAIHVPLIAVYLLVSACTTTGMQTDGLNRENEINRLLLQSAQNIEQSLTRLAEAEQFERMQQRPGEPRIYKQVRGMEQVVTMPWHGPIEPAIQKLASLSAFRLKWMGRQPAMPILVQIGQNPATVSDHLRNLGIQAGSYADIFVDPNRKLIEVRYGHEQI